MASRSHKPVQTPRSEVVILTARLVGGGATTALALPELAFQGGGEIVSAAHAGSPGTYNLVFRHRYPDLRSAPDFTFVGPVAGLTGRCTAIDTNAGTATVVFDVGAVPTDLPTTVTVYMNWIVRNSGANR